MNYFLYPKKISFYGGASYKGAGFVIPDGQFPQANKGAHASGGNFSVNTVADDPNGIVVSYTKSASGSQSGWADCDGKEHAFWGDDTYNETGVYQVGKGLSIDGKSVHNAYHKGGDLYCFGAHFEGVGHTNYANNFRIIHRYEKLAWPTERIITLRSGNYYGANQSASWTQLAKGYFTGPRTYKTTGSQYGFTIQGKTSLKWSHYVRSITIDVTGPHTSQKSKPENFLWVAGGLLGGDYFPFSTRVVELGACYYDFREKNVAQVHPNYLKLIGSVKSIMSTSSEGFTLSGTGYPNFFTSHSSTNSGVQGLTMYGGTGSTLELNGFNTIVQGGIYSGEESANTTEWKSHSEDEPWPIISTERTVGNKVVWTTTNSGYGRHGLGQRMVFTASKGEDGSYYLSTAMGNSYVGNVLPYGYFTSASGETNTAKGGGLRVYGQQNKTTYGGEQDYYITECREFGVISRKYKTSHRGYYFTNPDTVYQDAKIFDTYSYFDVSAYSCHDATCIDMQRYARKTAFQTAKTLNNNIVKATLRVPRYANTTKKVTMTLQKQQGYSKSQYEETRIWDDRYDSAPIWGHPKYKKNKYGEDATYKFTGFKTVTVGGTATRLVPITQSGEAHTESWRAVGYDAPANNWYYNPWQSPLPSQ